MDDLKAIASQVIAAEFEKGLSAGLIPSDTDESEIKSLYEFNVELLYELICADVEIKAKVIDSQKQNTVLSVEEIFSLQCI